MELPNKEKAFIPKLKLKNYLLSENHIIGRSKAKFFKGFGFDETNIELLEKFLIKIAQTYNITKKIESPYGTKYIIDGKLYSPIRKSILIRTIWIIEKNTEKPRFVTAYPK